MPTFHGSSYYKLGQGTTGETGPTGPTGPAGLIGSSVGSTGVTGDSIVGITLDNSTKLFVTEFQTEDGITYDYSTQNPMTGVYVVNTNVFLFGGNTYNADILGATAFKETVVSEDHKMVLRVLGAGQGISIRNNDDDIQIVTDGIFGDFGYVNVTGGGQTGNIVGISGGKFTGISRSKYNPIDNQSRTPLTAVNKNLAEYFSYKERSTSDITPDEGYYVSLLDGTVEGLTALSVELFSSGVDTNYNVFFDIHGLINSSSYGLVDSSSSAYCYFDIPSPPQELQQYCNTFMLVTNGVTGSIETNFSENVKWALNDEPCFSGKVDITTFFSEGDTWYGVPLYRNNDFDEDSLFSCKNAQATSYHSGGITGACCEGTGTCIHSTEGSCNGYFYGPGTTCGYTGNSGISGSTGNICHGRGGCCIRKNGIREDYNCYDDISCNECINFNLLENITSTYLGDDVECENSQKCFYAEDKFGICCNGTGKCINLDRNECEKIDYFFSNIGNSCSQGYYKNKSYKDVTTPCSSGTGGCCIESVCYDDYSFSDCMNTGGLFTGANTECVGISCPATGGVKEPKNKEYCNYFVDGVPLETGDLFGGGVVVGVYDPSSSLCLGDTGFGGNHTDYQNLLLAGSTSGLSSGIYRSKLDYHGYGFNTDQPLSQVGNLLSEDSYLLIVSMEPIAITGDRQIVNYSDSPGATNEFYWGNNGCSWGPLYNNYGIYDEIDDGYAKNYLTYKEGFWYNSIVGAPSLDNIIPNSFTSQKRATLISNNPYDKLMTRPIQSINGLWHRNWGLYNTIRMISADNILYHGYTSSSPNAYTSSDYGPGLTSDYISAMRAIRLLDDGITSESQGNTANPNNISGWYVPSHDELAFMAANCVLDDYNPYGFNLNIKLLEEGGSPLDGIMWSSTGAFDTSYYGIIGNDTHDLMDGIYSNVGLSAGSMAWCVNFDSNGIINNFKSIKRNRTKELAQVRPVRLIRCDKRYHTDKESNGDKLWRLPPVYRDKDRGINQ